MIVYPRRRECNRVNPDSAEAVQFAELIEQQTKRLALTLADVLDRSGERLPAEQLARVRRKLASTIGGLILLTLTVDDLREGQPCT